MKLEFHHSLEKTIEVLTKVGSLLDQVNTAKEAYVTVGSWANSREQGFYLSESHNKRGVVFAENRNSDDILVIKGPCDEFDGQTNQPSEKIYKDRQFFDCHNIQEAAEAIVKWLVKGEM